MYQLGKQSFTGGPRQAHKGTSVSNDPPLLSESCSPVWKANLKQASCIICWMDLDAHVECLLPKWLRVSVWCLQSNTTHTLLKHVNNSDICLETRRGPIRQERWSSWGWRMGLYLKNKVLFLRQTGFQGCCSTWGVYWVETEPFPMGSICPQLAVLYLGEPVESLESGVWQTEIGQKWVSASCTQRLPQVSLCVLVCCEVNSLCRTTPF